VCAPLKSTVNLSRIVRAAGCFGIMRVIACGGGKVDPAIARDAAETVTVESRRSLDPLLPRLRDDGYRLVGLEQATDSIPLPDFAFPRRTALILGGEREGLTDETLSLLDDVVEIPVFGLPHSFNVATATAVALYEYCRQWPEG